MNKKPIWVIENLAKEESFTALAKAVADAGTCTLLRLNGDYTQGLIKEIEDQCVIFNGSIHMTGLIGRQLVMAGNAPVTFCTFKNYLCTSYYGPLGKYLFNDRYAMIPLAELERQKYLFYGVFGKEGMMFIRPDSGEKTFKGGLVDIQDFDRFCDEFEYCKNELVIVSTPKNIVGEWRFVVTDERNIVAQSSYRYQGQTTKIPSAPVAATNLCQQILMEGYFPDPVFCIDICQDSDGNHWLMELTSFSSAGLYACNMENIAREVPKIAIREYNKQVSVHERI